MELIAVTVRAQRCRRIRDESEGVPSRSRQTDGTPPASGLVPPLRPTPLIHRRHRPLGTAHRSTRTELRSPRPRQSPKPGDGGDSFSLRPSAVASCAVQSTTAVGTRGDTDRALFLNLTFPNAGTQDGGRLARRKGGCAVHSSSMLSPGTSLKPECHYLCAYVVY